MIKGGINFQRESSAIDGETLEKGRKLVRSDLQEVKKAEDALRVSVTDNNVEDARIAIRDAFSDLWAYQPDILFLEWEVVTKLYESVRRCLELVSAVECPTDCVSRCHGIMKRKKAWL